MMGGEIMITDHLRRRIADLEVENTALRAQFSAQADVRALDVTEISDQAMRHLLTATNVGQGRSRLREIILALALQEKQR